MLKNKKIIVGVTGSIAAYKACTLVRLLKKAGAEVQVILTPSAKEFITPTTLAALSERGVVSEFFEHDDGTWHSHVKMGLWADAMVIAPATASTIAKMRMGMSENILLATYLSMRKTVFVAPAMDLDMYAHPATQENLQVLRQRGHIVVAPTDGELASGLVGKGRLADPEDIVRALEFHLDSRKRLKGKRVLVTAGPTYEKIDPVRFIGNFSSGKMGFALAESLAAEGAEVSLISGPVSQTTSMSGIKRYDVMNAAEMYDKAMELFPKSDIAILAAAVADFTVHMAEQKIKRKGDMMLTLHPTRDIAAALGAEKREGQLLVGFALETNDEERNAIRKLKHKHLDFIVLNSLNTPGACFGYDTNQVTFLTKEGEKKCFELKEKSAVAADIVNFLCEQYY